MVNQCKWMRSFAAGVCAAALAACSLAPQPEEAGRPQEGRPPFAVEPGSPADAAELFQDAFPDPEGVENPFDVEAVREEIRQVLEASRPVYETMERQPDWFGRIWRPTPEQRRGAAASIAALGYPVAGKQGADLDTGNAEVLRSFYEDVLAGRESETCVYEMDALGALHRVGLLYRDGELFYGEVSVTWTEEGEAEIGPMGEIYRLDYLVLSEKNYLLLGNEKTGFAGIGVGYRLEPLGEESRALRDRYLAPLAGYNGHNVLVENWDGESLASVAFNDVFEMLYRYETGRDPWEEFPEPYAARPYIRAIPRAIFEETVCRYFSITPEELRETAVYDSGQEAYAWLLYSRSGRSLDWEVVDARWNPDGSLTLTVDALYLQNGIDRAATSRITVLLGEGDSFRYLSNEVEIEEMAAHWFPPYRPRVKQEGGNDGD